MGQLAVRAGDASKVSLQYTCSVYTRLIRIRDIINLEVQGIRYNTVQNIQPMFMTREPCEPWASTVYPPQIGVSRMNWPLQ